MTEQTNIPAAETDQMDPIRGLIHQARQRVIAEDAARAAELRPKIAVAQEALDLREAHWAAEVADSEERFRKAQAVADAAQKLLIATRLERDSDCVPLRAEVARLTSLLHQPSAGFAQRDPANWKRVPGVAATPGSNTPHGQYWDPNETHPHGPLNPRMEGGRD
jgi:hypothetical protein